MSTTEKITDPIEQIRQLEQEGIEQLRAQREADAAAEGVEQRAAAIRAQRRAELEERFARVEAERTRLEHVEQARHNYRAVLDAYTPLSETGDDLHRQVGKLFAEVIQLTGDAILAERTRVEAGKSLLTAHAQLAAVDDQAPAVDVKAIRLHSAANRDSAEDLLLLAVLLGDDRFVDQRQEVLDSLHPKPILPNITVNAAR